MSTDETITDVEVISFHYETRIVRDPFGHAHPGPPREATANLLVLRSSGGHEGYALCGDRGEIDTLGRPLLTGADPFAREPVWQALSHSQRSGLGGISDRGFCAIDLALWDLAGKILAMPVHRLLGAGRTRVPAYASTMCGDEDPSGLGTPEAYADFAEQCLEAGYRAFKLHTWMPPTPGAPDVARDIAACRAVRERVGDRMELMLDPYHYYDRLDALRLARAIAELDFLWLEEPMDERSIAAYRWLTSRADVPVVGPETSPGGLHVRANWVANEASDVLRAGVHGVGGLTGLMKTIALAEAHGMGLEVHLSGPGNLQALAAMGIPGRYYERGLLHPKYDYDARAPYLRTPFDGMDDQGFVTLSDAPGLGFDIDLDYVEQHRIP